MPKVASSCRSIPSYKLLRSVVFLFPLTSVLLAQSATYHLHQEASATSGLNQLKTQGPDAAAATLQSAQLRNSSPGNYVVKQFDTQPGVPGVSGVIPAGSTVTFTVWMRKTAAFGTMYPRAELRLNGASGTYLFTALGSCKSRAFVNRPGESRFLGTGA
jgi:hypothetical protein